MIKTLIETIEYAENEATEEDIDAAEYYDKLINIKIMTEITKEQYLKAFKTIAAAQAIIDSYRAQNNLSKHTLFANYKPEDFKFLYDSNNRSPQNHFITIASPIQQDIQRIMGSNGSYYHGSQRFPGDVDYTSKVLINWFKARGLVLSKKESALFKKYIINIIKKHLE